MRFFWFFLPFAIALGIISAIYLLSPVLIFVNLGIVFILGAIIFVNSLRLAKSNLEVKIERNEMKSIVSNLKDGIVAYDPNFKFLIFNTAAEQIFNVPSNEVVGKLFSPEKATEPHFKLLAQVVFPSLAPLMIQRSEPGKFPQVAELSFEELQIELRVITDKITDSSGQLLGFVKLIQDKTREMSLIKSKTEFISVAAHQLRTPLSAIHWSFENLMKQPLNPEEKEIAEAGLGATIKLLKIVNDLLDISKIEEGRFGYQFENADIVKFIEETIAEAIELNKQSSVKIYFKRPAEQEIMISFDAQKLKMALFNLLDNAIKYNTENGEVVVEAEKLADKPYAQISVKDTGVGIPPQEINKLFTKFFRAENVMKIVTEGSGLGLYIVRNIIRRHGGDIRAESELGRGTTFYFTLPTDPQLIPPKEIVYGE